MSQQTINGRDINRHRVMASMSINAAAAALTTRLGRLITVNILAGWENGFIVVPSDFRMEMIAPLDPLPIPTAADPVVLWSQIEHRLKPAARAAAIAMCKMRDEGDEDKPCPCVCDEKLCIAWKNFGREAVAAVVAVDAIQSGRLHAGIYSIDWQREEKR